MLSTSSELEKGFCMKLKAPWRMALTAEATWPLPVTKIMGGLSVVKRIVERHGGKVVAAGELGQGACIRVYLPC
jgi:hypothetical protein